MYTIKQVAKQAGISTRTLRYYDRIGLLHSSYRSESNYRLYTEDDLLLLQQILLYKEMDVPLSDIKVILEAENFQIIDSLEQHLLKLKQKQKRLQRLQDTVTHTIQHLQGGNNMKQDDLFNGFKEQAIKDNEQNYGKELRDTYGSSTINASYEKMRKMSKWQWNHAEELAEEILSLLPNAMKEGPKSDQAQLICKKHQEWIQLYWTEYSKEAHLGLCKMYTEDERFTAYYDKVQEGAARFLYQAMTFYLN